MSIERRRTFIDGNTVRKMQPLEQPTRERRSSGQTHRRGKEQSIQYVNVFYTIFLIAAACMVLWSCVNYLQLQAETTSRVKHIAALETQLEDLRKENEYNKKNLKKE